MIKIAATYGSSDAGERAWVENSYEFADARIRFLVAQLARPEIHATAPESITITRF